MAPVAAGRRDHMSCEASQGWKVSLLLMITCWSMPLWLSVCLGSHGDTSATSHTYVRMHAHTHVHQNTDVFLLHSSSLYHLTAVSWEIKVHHVDWHEVVLSHKITKWPKFYYIRSYQFWYVENVGGASKLSWEEKWAKRVSPSLKSIPPLGRQ